MPSLRAIRWKYFLIGVIRRQLPQKILFAVMKRRGDGSLEEQVPRHCLEVLLKQLNAHGLELAKKIVLEIGSGRFARFALQLLAAGAQRVINVDPLAVSLDDIRHKEVLLSDCVSLDLDPEDAFSRIEVENKDFTVLAVPPLENQVDLVISSSVLEHVKDPKAVLQSSFNWLKPGGMTLHLIDLRDHNFRFRHPFEMLTYSDTVWAKWLDLDGAFHVNRLRLPDYINVAREIGFQRINYEILSKDEAELTAVIDRIQPEFRTVPHEILALLTVALNGQKPMAAASV
jgi:SAM-dependent methyltransferase